MFGLFRPNPIKKLNQQYQAFLQKAMEAQRSGDIRLYSELSEKADIILKQIEGRDEQRSTK